MQTEGKGGEGGGGRDPPGGMKESIGIVGALHAPPRSNGMTGETEEVADMKSIREIFPKGKEAAFASGLLLLYGTALFLSPDPEWTLWAAQMAIGVMYVPDAPTLQGIAPGETMRLMSAAGTFGIFVAAALLALGIKTSCKPPTAYRPHPSEETDAAAL
jgi:hypothetical protein